MAGIGKGGQLSGNRATLAKLCGRPYNAVVANVLAHVLYLCSDEPDLMRGPVREVGGGRVGRAAGGLPDGVQVWSAGYHLGAALRQARQEAKSEPGVPTGRTGHAAHAGLALAPLLDGAQVRGPDPVLKLLAPVAVNFRLEDGEGNPLTVVRPARAPGR